MCGQRESKAPYPCIYRRSSGTCRVLMILLVRMQLTASGKDGSGETLWVPWIENKKSKTPAFVPSLNGLSGPHSLDL